MAGQENPEPEPHADGDGRTPAADAAGEPQSPPAQAGTPPSDTPLPDAPVAPEPPARPGSGTGPADETATTPEGEDERPRSRRMPDWNRLGRRVLVWLGIAVAVVALYFLLASFLPRWWAQRMGQLVDGSFPLGVWWGLFFGALFTAIPILVIWMAFRRDLPWRLRLVIVGVAILLAAPNLLTLSVVLGTNNAAHAGERIFDVEAPAFRGGALAGAIIGAVVAAGLILLFSAYKRRGRKIRQLEYERESNR